ncbi:hypothetical protein IRJ41_008485 [Triplophysa rosa]|uniref:Uncharacterized protein n=1 Tax=Triplophysa rosa TaxID=992332 RepID=A0A9W7WHX8_TRIRA|nr:hypothetical protein IRJ41_008485 [Triplophysa rosa]
MTHPHHSKVIQTHLIRHESKKTESACLIQEMNLQLKVHLKSSPDSLQKFKYAEIPVLSRKVEVYKPD